MAVMSREQERFHQHYGPWAVVAGASEGLGAAWATHLAAYGLNLVLVARRQPLLDDLAARLAQQHGIQTRTLALDLAAPETPDALIAATQDLDVGLLIYNAARSVIGPFLERPLEDHLAEIAVNVRAPMALSHAFGQRYVARGRGGIILLSSLSATMGSAYIADYAATKAYNLILGEGLWEELRAKGVDVLACCPSAISTPNYAASAPKNQQAVVTPDLVVAQTLRQLGRRPSFIPGTNNQMFAFILRRLLPRRTVTRLMGRVMRGMYAK
jgi:short-subunit dehydrogenase